MQYELDRVRTELTSYEPDMVLIYVGWNDLMKVDPTSAADTDRHTWLARTVDRSYLLKAYRKLLFFYLRPLIMKPMPDAGEADAHAFDQFVPVWFEKNLESMIDALKAKRIQPVLLTLPTAVEAGLSADELTRRHIIFPYYAGTYSVGRFLSLHRAYNRVIRNVPARHEL